MVDLGGGQDGPIEHGFSNTVFIIPGIIFVSLSAPDISNKADGLPSQEELLENLEKMNLSDTLKEELRQGILRGTAQVKPGGTTAFLGEISILLILVSLEAKTGKDDDASVDQVAELLDKLNLSNPIAKQLLSEILQGGQFSSGPVARMKAWLGDIPMLLVLVSILRLQIIQIASGKRKKEAGEEAAETAEKEEITLQGTQNDLSDIEIPAIPEDIIFPDELNRYLRDQIRYYLQENCMLKKNLENLESEYNDCKSLIREMERKLKKSSEMEKYVPSNQVTSVKIVELSKKLREKTSEVESLKSRCSKLEFQLFQIQNQNDVLKVPPVVEAVPTNELEDQIKKLQEKLSIAQNKLSELNNTNLQLKNDLKSANKYLQQEIGDGFESLHTFSSNPGNWRGRAQIICDLQQKNSDLKEKLKALQENMLSKENADMKSKYDGLKRKYEASHARIKAFENDCTLLKTKLTISTVLNHKERTIAKLEKEKDQLVKELEEYKSVIINLKNELKGVRNASCKVEDDREINSTAAVVENSQASNDALNRLKKEKDQLLELLERQNNRLNSEREAHAKTQSLLRLEKQKALKAEALATLESNTGRSSSYSMNANTRPMDYSLKNQLELAEENIKALKTRLEIEQFERKQDIEEFAKLLRLENKD
nr:unnamed protein product [Callosobruchus analis]